MAIVADGLKAPTLAVAKGMRVFAGALGEQPLTLQVI